MTKVISVVNNKGGVGKTTSTGIMCELLAYTGKRVLAIDLDQQSNLSLYFNSYVEDSEEVINGIYEAQIPNIADVFKEKAKYRNREEMIKVIQHTDVENLDIIPSSRRHMHTQLNISKDATGNNNIILKRALETVKDFYDYILIDNAPASDILTVNSMIASDYVIVPVGAEAFSHKGLIETVNSIDHIKEEHGLDNIKFLGAFITQDEPNTNISRDIKENYLSELGCKFFNTSIRKDIRVKEAETIFVPLLQHNPNTNAVYDYVCLLLETNILGEEETQILKEAIGRE